MGIKTQDIKARDEKPPSLEKEIREEKRELQRN